MSSFIEPEPTIYRSKLGVAIISKIGKSKGAGGESFNYLKPKAIYTQLIKHKKFGSSWSSESVLQNLSTKR